LINWNVVKRSYLYHLPVAVTVFYVKSFYVLRTNHTILFCLKGGICKGVTVIGIMIEVGFEVITAVVINVAIFWDIVSHSPYVNQRFGGTYHLHLWGKKSAKQETCMQNSAKPPAACWLLALLIFDPEDGGDTSLRNVGSHVDYTVLYPGRWQYQDRSSLF
jgi:hypothetical protein